MGSLTPEEKLREQTLNKELKVFNLSLDNTIQDVYKRSDIDSELQAEKISRLKNVTANDFKTVTEILLNQLRQEVDDKPKYLTYAQITQRCYHLTAEKRNDKLSYFEFDLYENHASYPPKMTPEKHIGLCLDAIARGIGLYHFLQSEQAEIDMQKQKLTDLANDKLGVIFTVSKYSDFRKIEQRLYGRNYINENRKWQAKAPELVALILVLKDNRYFKKTSTDKLIKNFFEELYQISIKQQFKPSKQPNSEKHKTTFTAIINDP